MTVTNAFRISRPVLVLTDFQNGASFSTTASLLAAGSVLATTFATGTPTSIRGASMSLNNLKQLLDFVPGTSTLDLSTGRAPFFSIPLASLPTFVSGQTGSIELGSTGALPAPVSGTVAIRLETDVADVSRVLVDGAQSKIKDYFGQTVRIDLADGLEIGSTRTDDAGQAWLDLRFLTLFSYVSQGANLLTLALASSEKAGQFYLRFNGLPIALDQLLITELQANVVLDSAPNFAPRLELGDGASFRTYAAQAGRHFTFGSDFFFGADYVQGSTAGLDLLDPIENLSLATPASASLTPAVSWNLGRPVLMGKPASGSVWLGNGEAIEFPSLEAVTVSLDVPSATSIEADFVRLAGQVYRALSVAELAGLQYSVTSAQLSSSGPPELSFFVRDAAGALSTEFTARFEVLTASLQGSVRHGVSGLPVSGAEIAVSRSLGASADFRRIDSQADGSWRLEGLDFDQLVVSASREATSAEIARSLNAADALAALKLATGRELTTLPGTLGNASAATNSDALARFAADIDQNGNVDISDAKMILEVVAGVNEGQEIGWQFLPQLATGKAGQGSVAIETWLPGQGLQIQIDAVSQVDWLGILLGDVDGSWKTA
jgi:hypothetical protein